MSDDGHKTDGDGKAEPNRHDSASPTCLVKYPRTLHLPWSAEKAKDDRVLSSTLHFEDRQVVVTEKMDGENTSLYADHIHARSLSEARGADRSHVKQIWNRVRYNIPDGWRICGENVAAKHSILYEELPDWLLVFSVWNEQNTALSWAETLEFCTALGLTPATVLFEGAWEDCDFNTIEADVLRRGGEGYVVRVEESFAYDAFATSVAKWVREGHVQTDAHWRYQQRVWNKVGSNAGS